MKKHNSKRRNSLKLSPIAKAVSVSLIGLSLVQGTSQAATIEVGTHLDSQATAVTGLCSLRSAIATMDTGNTYGGCSIDGNSSNIIIFSSNLSSNTIGLTYGEINFSYATMIIDASNISDGITIDANSNSRILNIRSVDLVLDSITITGGSVSSGINTSGGGILANRSTLTLSNSLVSGNGASNNGGGIDIYDGTLSLENSTITSNISAANGGGIHASSSVVRLVNSNINDNTAENGAGLFASNRPNGSIGSVNLDKSKVSNNEAYDEGGGLYFKDISISITNTDIESNVAVAGAGISLRNDATLSATSSKIIDNNASFNGGGIRVQSVSVLELTNSTVSGNSASNGGGINIGPTGNNVDIEGSLISSNFASSYGGGIAHVGNFEIDGLFPISFVVSNSTISNNTATYGGGIEGDVVVTASTISGNSALLGGGVFTGILDNTTIINSTVSSNQAQFGGGMAAFYGTANLNNSTFSNNSAVIGGGIYATYLGTISMTNSIIANSANSDDCQVYNGTVSSNNASIIENGTCYTNARAIDPDLLPLANNGGSTFTHALSANSPALNTGRLNACPVVDQRGEKRGIEDSFCDVGAFELNIAGSPGLGYIPAILKLLLLDEED